jgi:hypothetical protein
MGEYDKALEVLKRQQVLCVELDDRPGSERCCGTLALICRELGNPLWWQFYQRKNAIGMTLQFEEALAYASWDWGILAALQQADPVLADSCLKQAASLMEGLGYLDERDRIAIDLNRLSVESNGVAAGRSA